MRLTLIVLLGCALAVAAAPSHGETAAPAPPGVYLTYSNPDSGTGNQNVYVQNDTDAVRNVTYRSVVNNGTSNQSKNTVAVAPHAKEWIGRTCAFDVQYQTVCGSTVTYTLL